MVVIPIIEVRQQAITCKRPPVYPVDLGLAHFIGRHQEGIPNLSIPSNNGIPKSTPFEPSFSMYSRHVTSILGGNLIITITHSGTKT